MSNRHPYQLREGANLRRVPSDKLADGIRTTTGVARSLHAYGEHQLAARAEELVMDAEDELKRRAATPRKLTALQQLALDLTAHPARCLVQRGGKWEVHQAGRQATPRRYSTLTVWRAWDENLLCGSRQDDFNSPQLFADWGMNLLGRSLRHPEKDDA